MKYGLSRSKLESIFRPLRQTYGQFTIEEYDFCDGKPPFGYVVLRFSYNNGRVMYKWRGSTRFYLESTSFEIDYAYRFINIT